MPAFVQLVLPGSTPGAPAGGVRFGPFQGAFRIGTDPKKVQIVLDPSGNLKPEHAVVTPYANGVFGIEPAPGAGLWLAVQGQPAVWPIQSPVQVNPGDHLIFGSPGGPRFALQVEAAAEAPRPADAIPTATVGWAGATQGARPGLGTAVGNEMIRQGTVRLLARPGPIRDAYSLWSRFRGGSLTSPYMLVSIVFGVLGALFAGTVSCTGILSTIWWKLTYH